MRQSLFDYCRLCQKQFLLDEWNPEKNLSLTPQTIARGSKQSVWWRCEKGRSWRAAVRSRVSGCGCPVCARCPVSS